MTKVPVKPRLVKVGTGAPAQPPRQASDAPRQAEPSPQIERAASPIAPQNLVSAESQGPETRHQQQQKLQAVKKAHSKQLQDRASAAPPPPVTLPKVTAKGVGALVLCGLLALGLVLRLTGNDQRSLQRASLPMSAEDARYMNPKATFGDDGQNIWRNPELTTAEKFLCKGLSNSTFCTQRPLHPFVEAFDFHGRELKFPGKATERTVAETIEYDDKSSFFH